MNRLVFLILISGFAASDGTAQVPWPVTPFDASHEITGAFAEYRDTGSAPHFHDAVDIPKPDRSPVYSVVDGRVTGVGSDWIRVDNYAYVHVAPALSLGDSTYARQTIVGTILDGYGHVHFKDGQPGAERQPLRKDGGLEPFEDPWAPSIDNVRFYSQPTRQRLGTQELAGLIEITFRVREPGGPPSARESRLNNGAYLVGYKVLSRDRQQEVYVPPNEGIRFQFDVKPSNAYVHHVFDRLQSSTSQHVYIVTNDLRQASAWNASDVDEGDYTVLLFAEDTRGNRAEHFVDVAVQHRDIIPPPQPTFTSVTSVDERADFRWTGGDADDLAGFRVYRSDLPQGPWTMQDPIGPSDRSFRGEVDEASYFYLAAVDTASAPNESEQTDVYGYSPDPEGRRLLIVDGFDRYGGSGSWHLPWHRFAAVHGSALAANGVGFETVTNEAVTTGVVDLRDYDAVIWALGDESTADETFSIAEQARVRGYLEEGGRLFVSGSEIAWDLGNRGSSSDQSFLREYLKVAYAGDDAGSRTVIGTDEGSFDGANLTYGSSPYQEDYPDYFTPVGGGVATLRYGNGRVAAVQYEGTFGAGTEEGRLIVLGFPFETITGSAAQAAVMARVVSFFFPEATSVEDPDVPLAGPKLAPPYPNPAAGSTTMTMVLPKADRVVISAYDVLGRRVAILAEGAYPPGRHEIHWTPEQAPGVYFVRLEAGGTTQIQRITIVR